MTPRVVRAQGARIFSSLAACSLTISVAPSAAPALDWQSGAGYRSAPLTLNGPGRAGFSVMSPATTGIHFTNALPESRHLTNQILLNGSGVAAGDIDGDGWCDLYFCRIDGRNALYRNCGGWRFEDITDQAGVACAGLSSTGAALADLDGDGDLDLIVNSLGNGTRVFFNDGHGRFTQAPTVFNPGKGGMTLALADIDGDGYLDLYVVNYRTTALMDMPNARATFKTVDGKLRVETVNGRPVTAPDLVDRFAIGPSGGLEENGEPDVLYRNLGGTNLAVVPFAGGNFLDKDGNPITQPPMDWGLAAMFRDINGDGLPDLYVCNDFQTPDRFWINQGAGKFRLLQRLAQRKTSLSAMAVDFADINRDGFDDFLVLDMMSREHQQRMRFLRRRDESAPLIGQFDDRPQYELNTLFLNRGDVTFAEVAQFSGLEAAEWAWSCTFLDVDLDGWEDLLVANGMERAARDLDVVARLKQLRATRQLSDAQIFQSRRMFPRLATANLAFRNRGDLTFEEVGRSWGFDFNGVSHAIATADLDNDGDLDLVLNNLNAEARVYRNESNAARIGVRLRGVPANTRGIGAKIWLYGGAVPLQSQEMICGGRYLSSDDAMRVFAAGSLTNEMRIEVRWRSGKRSVVNGVKANRIYEIDESAAENVPTSGLRRPTSDTRPVFEEVSQLIGHVHQEEEYDDFARQPLLPHKLSQLGPGVSWSDVDGDGWEDLIIGSGKGGKLAVYRNNGKGGFSRMTNGVLEQVVTRDQTGVLGFGKGKVLVGSANYEDGLAVGGSVREYDLMKGAIEDRLPGAEWSTGPLALGDLDGDGDLDLFVGGRVVPGRYPRAATSRIYVNEGDRFKLRQELPQVGLVSGAVWADLDEDGYPELILACEWGPIRVFHNEHGQLKEETKETGLSRYAGWWNGVAVGDFDGDGKLDIVASNWGRNTKYESHRTRPLQMFYADFDADGTVDIIEAHFDAVMQKTVPDRQLDVMARAMPFLRERFPSHRAYSQAGVEELLGDRMKIGSSLTADWLESTVFFNRGDRFEPRVLPAEAQMAPAFGVCVGDCDGDGNEDIFLSQNFFAVPSETPRYDAGRGLWLKGDGKGGFCAMAGQHSGVKVYGEQRGAALGDFNADGRIDLVVAQNGAATKLFQNTGAKAGLRVRVAGGPGNPTGVGAALRLEFGDRSGPVREIHAGSGYWSQDSAVQVLGTPEPPLQIRVRWPGGRQTTAAIPRQAREIRIKPDGTAEAIER